MKVVYPKSGSRLAAAVISSGIIPDGTCYWHAAATAEEAHYLSAVFNARCLSAFFSEQCRSSDRDFHKGPLENLPIPAYDAGNEHHANLARQSRRAHQRVAALVAERQEMRLRISRDDALRDPAMQPLLAAIDESARAILPDYCA